MERPRHSIELSKSDKFVEAISWLVLLSLWIFTFLNYADLPQQIPIHFNSKGEADNFGSKWSILSLPLIATILSVGMSILNKFPYLFNYPDTLNQDNYLVHYILATRLIRIVKLSLVAIFGAITYQTIQVANEERDGLGSWFLPISLVLIFLPIIFYLVKLSKLKPNNNGKGF